MSVSLRQRTSALFFGCGCVSFCVTQWPSLIAENSLPFAVLFVALLLFVCTFLAWRAIVYLDNEPYVNVVSTSDVISLAEITRRLPPAPGCRVLLMNGCQLSHVPDVVTRYTCLVRLSLRNNFLTSLVPLLSLHTLRALDCHGNMLQSIPPTMGTLLTSLIMLDLTNNPLLEPQGFALSCTRREETLTLLQHAETYYGRKKKCLNAAVTLMMAKMVSNKDGRWNCFATLPKDVVKMIASMVEHSEHEDIWDRV